MQSHSKKPKLPTVNAVYCFDKLSILIFRIQTLGLGMKMTSTYQTLQCLLDPQQWVGVFLHVGIKMAEIYTKT